MYYRTCPNCDAHLDPGERCDCQDKKEAAPLQRKRPQDKTPIVTLAESSTEVKHPRGAAMAEELRKLHNN